MRCKASGVFGSALSKHWRYSSSFRLRSSCSSMMLHANLQLGAAGRAGFLWSSPDRCSWFSVRRSFISFSGVFSGGLRCC